MRWPLQALQALQKARLQPLSRPSVESLCHPCITTTHLSYSILSLKLPPRPCAVLLVSINLQLLPSLECRWDMEAAEASWRAEAGISAASITIRPFAKVLTAMSRRSHKRFPRAGTNKPRKSHELIQPWSANTFPKKKHFENHGLVVDFLISVSQRTVYSWFQTRVYNLSYR